jgi:hydrogenase small subunit
MPGFPDKFMPFMEQPPGSLLSSQAVMTYGRAIHALRRFTQASLNQEPEWRQRGRELKSGYPGCNYRSK